MSRNQIDFYTVNEFVAVFHFLCCADEGGSNLTRQESALEVLIVFCGYFINHEFDLEFDYLHGCIVLEVVLIVKKESGWPTESRTRITRLMRSPLLVQFKLWANTLFSLI